MVLYKVTTKPKVPFDFLLYREKFLLYYYHHIDVDVKVIEIKSSVCYKFGIDEQFI